MWRPIGISKFGALKRMIWGEEPVEDKNSLKPNSHVHHSHKKRKASCGSTRDTNPIDCDDCVECDECTEKKPVISDCGDCWSSNPVSEKAQEVIRRTARIQSNATCNSNECDQLEGCFVAQNKPKNKIQKSPEIPKFLKVRHKIKNKEDITEDLKKSFYKSFSVELTGESIP